MTEPPSAYSFAGLRVGVPAEWNRRRHVTFTLPEDDGFSPTIEIVEDWVPPDVPLVLQRLADRRREELWRRLPRFDATEVAEEILAGRMTQRLEYVWRVEKRSMRARQIMWLDGRFLVTLSFLDREDRFERGVETFEEWLEGGSWTGVRPK
jgi:hypothetical protein